MNRTMAIIAVVLGILTVFVITETGYGSEGLESTDGPTCYINIDGIRYWAVPDADSKLYSNDTLICENIYVKDTKIRSGAFKNCTDLKRVICSIYVLSIEKSAFEGCTGLESIIMPRVKSIGESAFMNSSLSSIYVGTVLSDIGDYAFANCRNLSNPILADTKVVELGAGVFYNARILADDIRNVTSIDETAFDNADIRFLAMKTGQILFNDTPVRVYDDNNLFKEFSYYSDDSGDGVRIRVNAYAVMDPCDRDGNPIQATYSTEMRSSNPVTFSTILLDEGQECFLRTGWTTVHFQESLGIEDAVIQTGCGEYTLPDGPKMGDLEFLGWSVPGIEGYTSTVTPQVLAEMWPLVEPTAHYSSSHVTFDHSRLSPHLASSLTAGMDFTIDDTYPILGNIGNMGFACWIVNGTVFEGGDLITELSEHTAESVWAEDGLFVLTVHDCSAEVYSTMDTVCTAAVRLDSIQFTEPEDRILLGWSLTDGGDRIKGDTLRLVSDTDIYPVTKNRARFTITYMDGFDTIGTQVFNEGRPSAIDVELPGKDGKRFVRWMCDGSEYAMGDVIEIDRDLVFYSEWVSVPSYTVSYDIEPPVSLSVEEGSVISIGADAQPPDHMMLAGWTETGTESPVYADRDTYTVERNISFSPVWTDCPRYTLTVHGFNGSVSESSAYSDETITLIQPEPLEGYSFSGWGTGTDSQPLYHPGDELLLREDTELFEAWTENGTFTVIVHDGSSEPLTAFIGESITVCLSPLSKEGYRHIGWNESEDSVTPEHDAECELVLMESTDLYPVWERLAVLRYHDGDSVQSEYHPKGSSVVLKTLPDKDLLFAGWSEEPEGIPVDSESFEILDDEDLYALWEAVLDEEPDAAGSVNDGQHVGTGAGLVEGVTAATVALVVGLMAYFIRRN